MNRMPIDLLAGIHILAAAVIVSLMFTAASVAEGGFAELQKIVPGEATIENYFGRSISISGATAVIGASGDHDGFPSRTGSAYFYDQQTDGRWGQVVEVHASDRAVDDFFGSSVSIDGSRALVGAWGNDAAGIEAGAAYVFQRDSLGNWGEVAKLAPEDIVEGHHFGFSVALSGPYALVGSPQHDAAGDLSGAAYLFRDDGMGNWAQVAKLMGNDTDALDSLGWAVALNGSTALVGAPSHDVFSGQQVGAVYVFQPDDQGTWVQSAKLTGDNVFHDFFGYGLSIDGSTALVASPGRGKAYIFREDDSGNWERIDELQPAVFNAADAFGWSSVSLSGSIAVVGAGGADVGTGMVPGSAYVFQEDELGNWAQIARLMGSDSMAGDVFGGGVAARGATIFAGAYRHDGADVDSGAVYVFLIPEPPTAAPSLLAMFTLVAGGTFRCRCPRRLYCPT